MKRFNRCFSLIAPLILFFGCEEGKNAAVDPGARLPYAEINVVTLRKLDSPTDRVIDRLNEKFLTDLNCTIAFQDMSFAEAAQKYPVLISSGAEVDLIWGSSFWNSLNYAARGAFLDIEESMKRETPGLYAFYSPARWDEVRIRGKIYCVPCSGPLTRYSTYGFLYREDLRKEYGLPEIKNLDTMESYMRGIKKNMDIYPVVDNGGQLSMFNIYQDLNGLYVGFGEKPRSYGLAVSYEEKGEIFDFWESAEFEEACLLMRKWAEEGFWPENVLSSKEDITSVLLAGKSAASFHAHPDMAFTEVIYPSSITRPDWEWGYFHFSELIGKTLLQSPLGMFFAVPKTSDNPDRALAVLEKITLEKEYYRLVAYGSEGTDYQIDRYNSYEKLGGGFGKNGLGTFPVNPELELNSPGENMARDFKESLNRFETVRDFATRFIEDSAPYALERNGMTRVYDQYAKPLMAGVAPGAVPANIELLLSKAREAGRDTVKVSLSVQWAAYWEQTGRE